MKAKVCPECRRGTIMDKLKINDIVIDVCPECRGVYYDNGELKKILAGAIDPETVLERLPFDVTTLVCPCCGLTMDRVGAKKGLFKYEMHVCRGCMAIFLRNGQLLALKSHLSGSRPAQPSFFRPKTVMETRFQKSSSAAGDETPLPPKKSALSPAAKTIEMPPLPEKKAPPLDAKANEKAIFDEIINKKIGISPKDPGIDVEKHGELNPSLRSSASYPAGIQPRAGSSYVSASKIIKPVEKQEENNALSHYSNIKYDSAGEYDEISIPTYFFCLLSNLPVEVYNPRFYFPYILVGIIGANALVFLLSYYLESRAVTQIIHHGLAGPSVATYKSFYSLLGFTPLDFGSIKSFFNLISCQFVHAGFSHFFFNMYFLWVFGDNVCDIFYDYKEPLKREASFLLFFIAMGTIGSLTHLMISPTSPIPL
ncbi:MAG TPA: rhomboid family intramembrane serine protease, partial [Candidatus Wallbacteria bacterium]|nr:rhomboid family intramembrane serine protease [Candidatus Wallbacteria bacterium]